MASPPPAAAAPPRATYTEADFAYYEHVVRAVQEESSLTAYLDVGQTAFRACAHNFLHAELTAKELKCISAITRKYVAASVRATARFGEAQADAAKKAREGGEAVLALTGRGSGSR